MPILNVTGGPLSGQRFEVDRTLVFGRADADVLVGDDEVSRRHAEVRPVGEGLEIEDLGSTNGTWVNGERLARSMTLSSGDEIRIGRTVIEVEFEPERADLSVVRTVPSDGTVVASPPVPTASVPGAAAISSSSVPAPEDPFGSLAQSPPTRRRRSVHSRSVGPLVFSLAVIVVTAIALVAYFAQR